MEPFVRNHQRHIGLDAHRHDLRCESRVAQAHRTPLFEAKSLSHNPLPWPSPNCTRRQPWRVAPAAAGCSRPRLYCQRTGSSVHRFIKLSASPLWVAARRTHCAQPDGCMAEGRLTGGYWVLTSTADPLPKRRGKKRMCARSTRRPEPVFDGAVAPILKDRAAARARERAFLQRQCRHGPARLPTILGMPSAARKHKLRSTLGQ